MSKRDNSNGKISKQGLKGIGSAKGGSRMLYIDMSKECLCDEGIFE